MSIRSRLVRFRLWLIGALIAAGIIVVPVVVGGERDFSWTNPTLYTDGSVFNPATDQQSTLIHCTDTETSVAIDVIVVPGAATSVNAAMPPGNYSCYATVVSVEGAESFASNTITFTVDALIPNPPILND